MASHEETISFKNDVLLEIVLSVKHGWKNITNFKPDIDCNDCEICSEDLEDAYILKLPCGHIYHRNCILTNIGEYKRLKCPSCDYTVS